MKKVFDTDCLKSDLADYDEVKMDIPKGSGTKETSGPLSNANPPISIAAPKLLSSDMESISIFQPIQPPLQNEMCTYRWH